MVPSSASSVPDIIELFRPQDNIKLQDVGKMEMLNSVRVVPENQFIHYPIRSLRRWLGNVTRGYLG